VTSIPSAERPPRRRIASAVGLLFALIVPAALSAGGPGEFPQDTDVTRAILLNEAIMWGLALAVLAIVTFWERRPPSSVGLGPLTWPAARAGVLFSVLLVFLAGLAGKVIQLSGVSAQAGSQAALVMAMPIWLQLFAALSAGFTEEILFRGYAIERVTELTGSRWLGALIPVLVFGAVHAPFWGVGHALVAGVSGLWLTLIYLKTRNLWTVIIAHALLDGIAFAGIDYLTATGATS
jgi:membrane protease YdiL (CAAX protease family)